METGYGDRGSSPDHLAHSAPIHSFFRESPSLPLVVLPVVVALSYIPFPPFSPFTAFVLCSQWSLVLYIFARYQAGRRRQRSSDNRCLPYGESESLNEEDESLEFSSNFSFFFYPEENFSKFGIFEFSSQKNWADIVSRSVSVS